MEPTQPAELAPVLERLTGAVETLDTALAAISAHIEAQQQELGARIERIVAVVDESAAARQHLEQRIADLERANADLKAEAAQLRERAARKTLPPAMSMLLAKSGVEPQALLDPALLDKALAALSTEQRIAVKAEMARAGIID